MTGEVLDGIPNMVPAFSEEAFMAILRRGQAAGYQFRRLDDGMEFGPGKHFVLRHDVDISPFIARRLGRLAHSLGVKSNFFFQLNAETYNPFSQNVVEIIDQLRGEGHCVGLHIDLGTHPQDEALIYKTLEWFSNCVTPIDKVVSFHRPKSEALGRRFCQFASAYDDRVFKKDQYFSDSRRSDSFLLQLDDAISADMPLVQLLLHPEWWGGHAHAGEVWRDLSDRRRSELEIYVVANFTKVFSEVVEHEDRPFRV